MLGFSLLWSDQILMNKPRVADQIVEHIEQLILSGTLRPGDRLPAERVFCRQLSVSRPSLREALQKLAARQLVTTKRGGGTYITEALAQSLADPLLELIASSPGRLGDVLELRHAIESLAAHYAALRRTTADKSALRQSYKALITSHAQRDPSLEAQADADFHLAIAEASHNVVLVQVMRSLFALLHSSMRFSLENLYTHQPAIFDNLRDQHYHLLNAILNGDPEQARVASDNHINYVEKSLAEIDAARSPQANSHTHFSDTTLT